MRGTSLREIVDSAQKWVTIPPYRPIMFSLFLSLTRAPIIRARKIRAPTRLANRSACARVVFSSIIPSIARRGADAFPREMVISIVCRREGKNALGNNWEFAYREFYFSARAGFVYCEIDALRFVYICGSAVAG